MTLLHPQSSSEYSTREARQMRDVHIAGEGQFQMVADRDAEAKLTKARLSARVKTVIKLRENLSSIVNNLQDDGDRVYFGSTNDADDLRDLYDELQAWEWAKIASDVIADDPYEASRKAHAELQKLRENNAKQAAAVQGLVEALKRADRFITNGIELGFIRMPDKTTPDTAHETPNIIRAALANFAAYKASK